MLSVPFHSRIAQLSKILQGIFHIPFSNIYPPLAYSNLYASALDTRTTLYATGACRAEVATP
jgi:hypothetical protein